MIANRVRMRKKPKGDTWDVIFADPEVGRVLHTNGLIANANKSSIKELARIKSLNPTDEHDGSYFYNNEVITEFPELQYCTGLTDLNYAFFGCSSLITVGDIIPEGVTNLAYAFRDCPKLTSVPSIPEGVTSLRHTFYGCSSLTTAPDVPSSVTDLTRTFYSCTSINGIYIINTVTPPTYSYSLSNVRAIYVPLYSVSAYKGASGWAGHTSRIYPISN